MSPFESSSLLLTQSAIVATIGQIGGTGLHTLIRKILSKYRMETDRNLKHQLKYNKNK